MKPAELEAAIYFFSRNADMLFGNEHLRPIYSHSALHQSFIAELADPISLNRQFVPWQTLHFILMANLSPI